MYQDLIVHHSELTHGDRGIGSTLLEPQQNIVSGLKNLGFGGFVGNGGGIHSEDPGRHLHNLFAFEHAAAVGIELLESSADPLQETSGDTHILIQIIQFLLSLEFKYNKSTPS